MTKAEELRQKFVAMIKADGMITAPGCYDGLTATLISSAGFDCAYMTGAGTSIAKGFPDFGLMTMTEMVANAEVIANASNCPVICDADTGYGNELNMTRTVHEYERAGVTGIHIEDQGFPKKCGHLDDKEIIPIKTTLPRSGQPSQPAVIQTSRSSPAPMPAPRSASKKPSIAATPLSKPAPISSSSKHPKLWTSSKPCHSRSKGPACSTMSKAEKPLPSTSKP